MSVASISLAPMLSTLFFLTISGLALTAMWLAVPLLWKRHAPLVVAGSVALVAFFLVLPAAQATDVVIINGAGCQVTEEDAIGIFLHNDLYLRIDFPDSHWRFGLVNQGMKGLALVDVGVQAAQFTTKQYIIKRARDQSVVHDAGTGDFRPFHRDAGKPQLRG